MKNREHLGRICIDDILKEMNEQILDNYVMTAYDGGTACIMNALCDNLKSQRCELYRGSCNKCISGWLDDERCE